MHGIRHFLRNFTATALKEHLRSQIEDTDGVPNLTDEEILTEEVQKLTRATLSHGPSASA